ncbi:deoxynucleoside monophosphate kinase [Streptomyces phage BillNye]|uniref:Deoxynucleoside monophosphate kinase n=2 Tax=Wilnyevirus billnye TaxID=2560486 RepID=A0A2L1IVT5_9CAUD|nr:deoxynucleoside monophosphate kinase [Streptomyces phage BillNye]AVD99275.1 deoxynucleoside monophosphate kinase [Streptomyces phage BillNye]QBZ72358.1 deoxynucleoside monophosphate kinase [Streptomyces phage Circinus]
MKILGLAGYARSGKDTAGNALEADGWKRVAFADVLREFAYTLNPVIQSEHGFYTPLQWVIDEYGWNGYKRTQWAEGVRDLLQRLGTECGRELISQNIWVDATFNRMDPNFNYVISDMRFPNEASAILARGGHLLRIERPGVGPANGHKSETALDDWDLDVILNDRTQGQFEVEVRQYVAKYISS